MSVQDYIPHGMIAAFASVVTYVFRDHTKQDDRRFEEIKQGFAEISARQTTMTDTMAANHAELLRVMLEGEREKRL
jgi:hypothetical protein